MPMQLYLEARGVSASTSSSSSIGSTAGLQAFLLAFVCPHYTAIDLRSNKQLLDLVMQMSTSMIQLDN